MENLLVIHALEKKIIFNSIMHYGPKIVVVLFDSNEGECEEE
jgi:hypothetical protein